MIPRNTYQLADVQSRSRTVTVCVPARNESATISRTVDQLVALRDDHAIDEVVVLGGDSHDDTDVIAAAHGATIVDTSALATEYGPVLGKGDAMWRGLSTVTTDVVTFLDADLHADLAAIVLGLIGPLVAPAQGDASQPLPQFVKGAFRRHHPDFITEEDPYDGGRVTETLARPLINLFRPDLAGYYQPLGGQVAADVALLRSIPFLTGYAVEIAMLIDVVDRVGFDRVVEADLGDLENRPRSTTELAPMAQEVAYGLLSRVLGPAMVQTWQPYVRPRFAGGFDEAPARVVARPALDTLG